MTVSFNPPSQPGGNQLNPVAIWVQNLIDSLKAAFSQVNLIRPVIPSVMFETGAVATGTNGNMPGFADTIPTNTMGDQFMSLAYTPTNVGSTLIIDVICALVATSVASSPTAALYQDTTVNALASSIVSGGGPFFFAFRHKMTAGTTSATTFKVRIGMDRAGTLTFNGSGGSRVMGGTLASSITITEILP